ncbi:7909_t:CDS:2, partial [Gigaspora margarita]
MFENISFPSVDEVQKNWKRPNVIKFLEENKVELDLDDAHIQILKDNHVSGISFLELTLEELLASPYKLPGGPAKVISKLVKKIKGEGQGQKKEADVILTVDAKILQYSRRFKKEHSEASDKGNFMDFIDQYVPEHPEVSYGDVVKAFQESQGQGKETDTGLSKLINFTNEEEEVVRKAFVRDFRDPSDLSKRFMFFINKSLREYETTKDYYAPYTTLIQASGTGKSKLLMNFAENIMTVYCCLRDPKSSGYPSRSHIAKTLLDEFDNERKAIVTYLAYICACFQKLQEFNG